MQNPKDSLVINLPIVEETSRRNQRVAETMRRANRMSKIRNAFGLASSLGALASVASRGTPAGNYSIIFTGVALAAYLGAIIVENGRNQDFHDALANRM